MIIYEEANTPDTDGSFQQIKQGLIDDGKDFIFEQKGTCQVAIRKEGDSASAVIFDLETGYYLELIVASEERVLELAEAFGIDIG